MEDSERNIKLKEIVIKTNKTFPEEDEEFLNHIPQMHLSWPALTMLNKEKHMVEIYALVIVKIYNGTLPLEIEQRLLGLEDADYLLISITNAGHNWSSRATTIMERQHPKAYNRIFEQRRTASDLMR